jgi:hypothetical protein
MENLFARPSFDPEFYETFRRYAKEDGVDLDALSPYANVAALESFRRASNEAVRRAFAHQQLLTPTEQPVPTARSWWRRLLRLPA